MLYDVAALKLVVLGWLLASRNAIAEGSSLRGVAKVEAVHFKLHTVIYILSFSKKSY